MSDDRSYKLVLYIVYKEKEKLSHIIAELLSFLKNVSKPPLATSALLSSKLYPQLI